MKTRRGARRYAQPVFKFKRHRTPESVFLASFGPPSLKLKLEELTIQDNFGKETGPEGWIKSIVDMGVWGFVETRAKPPLVHFWTDGKRSKAELTHFFGHEMGHCVGVKAKHGWPEENRADDYGYVATLAGEAAQKVCRR